MSLLERLKVAPPDAPDWGRFEAVYRPLIRTWVSRVPGVHDEAADLAQEVFLVVLRELSRFERRREGSFRAWLRRVAAHRIRQFYRERTRRPAEADDWLNSFADPAGGLSEQFDREHDQHVLSHLLSTVRGDFEPNTWAAFERFVREGRPAKEVAEELDLTENAVILAKARVLRRLRSEAKGLID